LKNKLFIFAFLFCNLASAHEAYPEGPNYTIVSNVFDSTLPANKSKFIFQAKGLRIGGSLIELVYSANSFVDTIFLDDLNRFEILLDSGKYAFQFYYNREYREIFIHNIEIKPQHVITVNLHFKSNDDLEKKVKKPVIYLYPETPSLVELKVDPVGKLSFTYPEYREKWQVQADPSGELSINDKKYNYLFWEAEQTFYPGDFNTAEGFFVSKEKTVEFLEEKLTAYGLKSKEQADFITFWGPELMKNKNNFVQFIFDDACTKFADLNISPKPDHVNRIYIVFCQYDHLEYTEVSDQIIPKMNRDGFSVLEWGGVEIETMLESD